MAAPGVGNQKDPLPAGADLVFRVVVALAYTDESHGLSVVVVIPVVSQALMYKARYPGSWIKSMPRPSATGSCTNPAECNSLVIDEALILSG